MKKATIAHKLLFTEQRDYSFMCMELLTAVMICVHKYQGLFDNTSFDGRSFDRVFKTQSGENAPAFTEFFKNEFESIEYSKQAYSGPSPTFFLPSKPSLYGAILYTWCGMHSKRSVVFQIIRDSAYTQISSNYKDLLKFAEMINMVQ